MKAPWKQVVLSVVGGLFGLHGSVEAVWFDDPRKQPTAATSVWLGRFGVTADLPTSRLNSFKSRGTIPGNQGPGLVLEFSGKADTSFAGRGRARFMPIPITWDAVFMPIPTEWDAEVILISPQYGAMQGAVSVLKTPPTANKRRGPAPPGWLR